MGTAHEDYLVRQVEPDYSVDKLENPRLIVVLVVI